MASNSDQLALFNQYDDEYCSKSTAVATSIQKISALGGGVRPLLCLITRRSSSSTTNMFHQHVVPMALCFRLKSERVVGDTSTNWLFRISVLFT
jgi:hypothetical protein